MIRGVVGGMKTADSIKWCLDAIKDYNMSEFNFKPPKEQLSAALGSRKSAKTKVIQHEQRIADKLGGDRMPASGALAYKGDVSLKDFLLDSKETGGASINVHGKDLTKITREAEQTGKKPGLVLTIGDLPATIHKEWVCIPIDVFSDLLENVK